MAVYRDGSDDFAGSFHVDNTNQVFFNREHDVQSYMKYNSGGTTNNSSNQSKAYDLKFSPPVRQQDRLLPIAKISKIMKKSLPVGGMQSKEARECVQECVSEFISFITSEASDICSQNNRNVMNGDDIICAMSILGFDNYVEPMKLYLQKYREAKKGLQSVKTKDLPNNTFSNDTNHPNVLKHESLNDSEIMKNQVNRFINNP